MKAKEFTYIVVFQNCINKRVVRLYTGTFTQVFKEARFACSSTGYSICEIKLL